MAEYATYLIKPLKVGKEGRTAKERRRRKRSRASATEFGEKPPRKARQKNKFDKLNPR